MDRSNNSSSTNSGRSKIFYVPAEHFADAPRSPLEPLIRDRYDRLTKKSIDLGALTVVTDGCGPEGADRPGLAAIIKSIDSGGVQMLVVASITDLGPSESHYQAIIRNVVEHGGRFISLREDVDINHLAWRIMMSPTGTAAVDSNDLPLHTSVTTATLKEGAYSTSTRDLAYGFTSVFVDVRGEPITDPGRLTLSQISVDPECAKIVRQMFKQTIAGDTEASIAAWVTTNVDMKDVRHGSPPTTAAAVRSTLTNPQYKAVWTWGSTHLIYDQSGKLCRMRNTSPQTISVVHEDLRVVSDKVFDRVQAICNQSL